MDVQLSTPDLERRLAELAGAQFGVLSHAQLSRLGLRRGAIEKRLQAGRLHVLHRGVYAVGHVAMTREGRWLAAVLACGAEAALSHASAAALWELRPSTAARIDVTVPIRRRVRSTRRIKVHRTRRFEVTVHRGIPVTPPNRTLADLAEVVSRSALIRAAENAEGLRLLDRRAVEALNANAGRPGPARVLALLAEHDVTYPTRSDLEADFLSTCAVHDLPRPAVNAVIEGFEVDFSWRDQRVIVEADSRRHHGTRWAFEKDRARDARLTALGYRVVRFTHRQLAEQQDAVVDVLRRLLPVEPGRADPRTSPRRERRVPRTAHP